MGNKISHTDVFFLSQSESFKLIPDSIVALILY